MLLNTFQKNITKTPRYDKMRRKIYECKACADGYCTVRTRSYEKPSRCLHWKDYCNWVRIDKHQQKEMDEYE